MKNSFLIVIGGIPGAGKTTLAEKLSKDLHILFINKDGVLEKLWEALEWDGDKNDIPKFRNATFELIYELVRRAGQAKISIIIEANFNRKDHEARIVELAQANGLKIIYLHCEAAPEIAFERFKQREKNGERHRLHPSRNTFDEYSEAFLAGREHNLQLPGDTVVIELSDFSAHSYPDVLEKIQAIITN